MTQHEKPTFDLAYRPESYWDTLEQIFANIKGQRRREIIQEAVEAGQVRTLGDALFEDQSWQIVDGVRALQRQHPGQVHLVLGNHDHGHVGGPRLAKFYADEVAQLESRLSAAQVAQLRELFSQALLLALAPCGLFLSHGSPEETHFDLARLDRAALDPRQNSPEDNAMLRSLLTSYGQPQETCARLLDLVSAQSGLDLGVVVHGHDRDEEGWFMEGDNQLCPVLFGAPRQEKRYLEIDLGGRYRSAADLRDGVELKRLHPG